MTKKQYDAPEVTINLLCVDNVLSVSNVSLGEGEKGVWDNEIFGG